MMFTMYLQKTYYNGKPAVAYYRSPHFNNPICFNTWPSRPTYRNKYVMFNCAKYKVIWLPEKRQTESQL